VRAAVAPRFQADKPVGQWNHFESTVPGSEVRVVLNDRAVVEGAGIPDLSPRARIRLPRHGHKRNGHGDSPPALIEFKRIFVKGL
jgi:hypothetical protein